jgi:hypothetical protein
MVSVTAGLGPKKGPEAISWITYRHAFWSERAPHRSKTQISENIFNGNERTIGSQVPSCGLIPGQTGRLTVGRKKTLILNVTIEKGSKLRAFIIT